MTKSAPLFASVEELSEADIQAKIAELQAQLAEKARGKTIAEITELLIPSSIKELEAVKAFLLGKGTLTAPVKASKAVKAPKGNAALKKEFEVVNGKVFFGGEEITHTKKDKAGKLRIVKEGKGLPPEVAKQSAEIQAILNALPNK